MAHRRGFTTTRQLGVLLGLIICVAGFSWLSLAQDTTPPGYRPYRLRYTQAQQVATQLRQTLSEMQADHEVLADRATNRVLVQGSDHTQQLALGLIETLDRPPAHGNAPQAQRSPAFARGYHVPAGSLDSALQQLRERFPPSSGVRVAKDERTAQLIVIATDSVHQQIAESLRPSAQTGDAPQMTRLPDTGITANGYQLQHISWNDLEDDLDRIWAGRLSQATERNGELTIISTATQSGPRPVLKIDRRNNWVTFVGPPSLYRGWEGVVRALDHPRDSSDEDTELVALNRADPAKVHHAVSLMQTSEGDPENQMVAMVLQPQAEGAGQAAPAKPAPAGPPAAAKPNGAPAGAGDAAAMDAEVAETMEGGGLIGPVQIEFLDGLDVIVLRGHKRDVERVREIIADIERFSVETQPTIELYPLNFVGSQVMAELVSEIYDEILAPRQGQVTIRALVKPNSLLLIGRPESVDLVKQLIAKLDQPAKPESQFEIFRLKHISAVDAAETIEEFFVDGLGQAQQGQQFQGNLRPGLGTRVNVVADYRSNSLIVHASPRDMTEVRRMVAELDVESAGASNELRIFRLKNALSTDIAPVLQDALNWQLIGNRQPYGGSRTGTFGAGQGFGQTTDERARLRSAILTFMTVDSEGGKVLESGLLSDVRVTADANANALVVTGPAKSMGLIEALVDALDVLPSATAQIKVFTIVNGDATSLRDMLEELLGQQVQTGQATQGFSSISPFLQSNQQPAAGAGESSLVPVRFGVDQRTNSIIVTGSAGDLGVVEAVLLRLDEESYRDRKTTVYWLANSPAVDVATAVNEWLDEREALFDEQLQASPESPAEFFKREVIVVAEPISNSIIISATPDWFEEVKHVVQSLDRKPPMIKIDVLIAAVRIDDFYELGAELGIQDSLLFDRVSADTGVTPGYNFNNESLGDTGAAGGNVLGQALSTFALGRVSTEGYGGLVLSASSDAVSVLIRALQDDGYAQVLNRPQITTMDRQPASVDVGEIVSRLQGATNTNSGTTQDVEDIPTGLLLGVTPQVTPDGLVMMEVDVTRSQLSDTDFVLIPDGVGGTVPQFNIENVEASTTITARSGQTVVFAGLLTTRRADRDRGIPWLSRLPGIGPLFRFTQEENEREELLIVLTPHVIHTDEQIDWFRYSETERMSWCLADVHEVYGDVGFSSRPGCWCRGDCHCFASTPVIYPDENPTGDIDPAVMEPTPAEIPLENAGPELPPVPVQPSSRRTYRPDVESNNQAAIMPSPMPPAGQAHYPQGPPPPPTYPAAPAVYQGPPNAAVEQQAVFHRPPGNPGMNGYHGQPGNAPNQTADPYHPPRQQQPMPR